MPTLRSVALFPRGIELGAGIYGDFVVRLRMSAENDIFDFGLEAWSAWTRSLDMVSKFNVPEAHGVVSLVMGLFSDEFPSHWHTHLRRSTDLDRIVSLDSCWVQFSPFHLGPLASGSHIQTFRPLVTRCAHLPSLSPSQWLRAYPKLGLI